MTGWPSPTFNPSTGAPMEILRNARLVALPAFLILFSCAHSREAKNQEIEQLLSASGFTTKVADTPEKMENLRQMEQRKIIAHSMDDGVYYTYADAEGCGCLLAGDAAAYQRFSQLATDRKIAEDLRKAAEARERTAMNWGYWGPWPWW